MASSNLSEVVSKIQTIVLAQHKRIHASETKDIDEIPRHWTDPGNKNEYHINGPVAAGGISLLSKSNRLETKCTTIASFKFPDDVY